MKNDIKIWGDEQGYHITVRPAFGSEGFEVTVWNRNHGTGGFPPIREQEKAERIAEFLYTNLLPEFEEERRRQNESYERTVKERAARPKPKPPKIPKNAPRLKVLICPECSEPCLPDEVGDERVYECSTCGTTGTGEDGRRCDQCNKFTAKISDTSCPECDAPMDDAEEGEAQRATNGKLITCD